MSKPGLDQALLQDCTTTFVEAAQYLLDNVEGATGELLVNAMLSAAVNFAHSTKGDQHQLATALRKMAQGVPELFKACDAMATLRETIGKAAND